MRHVHFPKEIRRRSNVSTRNEIRKKGFLRTRGLHRQLITTRSLPSSYAAFRFRWRQSLFERRSGLKRLKSSFASVDSFPSKMADTVPMIAISGEADDENFSLSDSEEANKAKSLIASRMRRRQKKKRDAGESKTSAALIVDDGDESGMTDVETVECDGDDANTDSSVSNAADELAPVFEIRPHIVHIVEDEEGRMRVNTIVQGVIAVEDGQESEEDGQDGAKFVDVATDVESFEDTSSDEGESVSESSELRNTIGNMDIGGDVNTRNIEEEGKVVALPSFGASLQLPTGGKKKVRKHRSKKKAAATATSGGLLAVGSRDDEQLTDVESISGIEELECDSPSQTPSRPAAFLTVTPAADEGATDVESLSGVDDESASVSIHLAPGILVTGDDDGSSCSGRSSRLGLTDVEELAGDESPLLGLSVPQASADPLTDVEDIDGVDEEEGVSRRVPRNGPAAHRGQSHVVDISVDEDGRITSRKSARSPALLSVGLGQDDGGVTETESVGVSGDESEDVSTEHPAPEINLESTTVEHKSDPAEQEDPDAAGNETSGGTGYTLMPPTTAAEILTDTEEMEVSDSEGPASTEPEDQAASAAYQQYDPTCSAISESEPSLPSQPEWSDRAQGGN